MESSPEISGSSNLGLETAGPGDAPAAQSLINGEQTSHHKNQAEPQLVIYRDNAGNETNRPNHTAGNAALPFEIGAEKLAHANNVPHRFTVASRAN